MEVRIEIDNDRIILRSEYSPSIPVKCKTVPGARWVKSSRVWSFPLDMISCKKLRKAFGDDLVIGPGLWRWAENEKAAIQEAKALGAARDADLASVPAISPILAEAMQSRTYQKSGARFIATAGNSLNADEPGLGKTATALAGLMESGLWKGQHLVIAPKSSLHSVWARQIEKWTPGVAFAMPEGKLQRERVLVEFLASDAEAKFLCVNPAMIRRLYGRYCAGCEAWIMRKDDADAPSELHFTDGHKPKRAIKTENFPGLFSVEWDCIILDESHEILSAYVPSNQTQSVTGLFDLQSRKRIALTGTPLRGRESKIWGTLNWLDPKTYSSYWRFIEQYFEMSHNGFGIEIGNMRSESISDFHSELDRRVVRRLRSEVRSDLPVGQRQDVWVQMDVKHAKQYAEFQKMGEIALESGTLSAMGTLAELTRLRQMAMGEWDVKSGKMSLKSSPKIGILIEMLAARGVTGKASTDFLPESGEAFKYVIASQFTTVLDGVRSELDKLSIPSLTITGAVTGKKRDRAQEEFQSADSSVRVILINTKAGGVAIELDAWCDEMFILDETFVADDQLQLEGRINNRSGRISPRTWYYIRTEGTIEDDIAHSNLSQQELQFALLDGRRGADMALTLLGKTSTKLA